MARFQLMVVLVAVMVVSGSLSCSGRVGGVPEELRLSAASDVTVLLEWDEPEAGTPDNYIVYFRPVGTEGYVPIVELVGTRLDHDPSGMTGWYRVAALFGSDLYYAAETLSTVPVESPEERLAELNASGNSGFGWDRATGLGLSYSMRDAGSAAGVDLFVTDFYPGHEGQYALASPTYGPSDPSGEVPQASWRFTRFTADLPDERAPLPEYAEQTYLPFRDVEAGFAIGCHTEDGYFAFVKVTGVNELTGELRLRSWFQLVPGLRLIRH
ncbi:MAG: fibronectin type III domain-containing protein [bacterium]